MGNDQNIPIASSTKKSCMRSFSRWLAVVCVPLLGLVLFLPTMLGSKWIYDPLLKRLANDDFELGIDSVKLSWFSPLEFQGITVRQTIPTDSEPIGASSSTPFPSAPLISIRSIQSNRGLFGYLLNGRNLGRIQINEPKLGIALLEDGSNVERLIHALNNSQTQTQTNTKSQPKLDLDIAIRGLSVQVEPPDGGKIIEVVPPLNGDISYRALNVEPQVIVGPTQLLDQAELTPELVRLGLGLAVPLLSKSAWFDGRVSLATQEIRIPLDRAAQSTGEAVLTLHQVRSGPSEPLIIGALDALANLRGKEPNHELVFVDGAQVTVQVANERVFHSGLEAGLPKLDQRLQISTEGYVGLSDRSLDLKVEIPIPLEQLARRESVQRIGVPRLKLPIGGTLDHPEVKWDAMRGDSATLLAVIAGTLKNEAPVTSSIVDVIGGVTEGQADQAIEAAASFVRMLRERRSQNNANANANLPSDPKTPAAEKESEPVRRGPLRDALRRALKRD
jgi:hypothetical protein